MRVYLRAYTWPLAWALCVSPAAIAQTGPSADTVVIESSRMQQTAVQAGVDVTVIDAADIERRALVLAEDALAMAPGVTLSSAGAFGGVGYARIRGNGPGQTVVLVDGVRMDDPSAPGGGFDVSTFDLSDVERIEILHGPQSTLWGSDAIGGVIAITTKQPARGQSFRGFVEAGSFKSVRAGASADGADDRFDGRVAAVWRQSDGLSKADAANGNAEKDGYSAFTLAARGGVALADGLRFDASARWARANFGLDGYPPPNFLLADTNDVGQSVEASGDARLTALAFEGRLQSVFEVTRLESDRKTHLFASLTSRNDGSEIGYRYSGLLKLAAGQRLAFGAERDDSRADGANAAAQSAFGLYEWTPTPRLTLTGGLRYDDDRRYGSATTGKVALSFQATNTLHVRGTWGQGFMAPTIFQSTYVCTFCLHAQTLPNRDLKAARSEAYDVGVDWTVGGALASLTAFNQRTSDLIDFSFASGYANINLARQKGVEASLATPIIGWLSGRLSYAYIDAKDGQGAPLPRAPRNSGDLELILAPSPSVSLSAALRYNGAQADGTGVDVKEWARTDLAATWRFHPGVEIYGRIENLFDRRYEEVAGYGTPGLSGRIGLRLSR